MPSYAPSGFFALRTPLLPFDELLKWGEGLDAPVAFAEWEPNPGRLADAVERDRALLRERLLQIVARPEVRDALFLGSPDLDEALINLRDAHNHRNGTGGGGDRVRRVDRSLVRYFARMAARPTPFGLFAGTSVGTLAGATRLVVGDRSLNRRQTRLDLGYISALVDGIADDPALRTVLHYRPNPTLYRAADRLRYVEWRNDVEKERTHHLVAVDATAYLRATIERAEQGAGLDTLAAALVTDAITRADADAFIAELVASRLLVPELPVTVTGPEAVQQLVDALRSYSTSAPAAGALADTLCAVRAELGAIDAGGLGSDPARYRSAAQRLETAPAELKLGRLFQVELTKPDAGATLGGTVVAELLRGVELLHRLSPARPDPFARFREAFVTRYEGRRVPLVEALDDEAGVGFSESSGIDGAEPLLAGLEFPARDAPTVPWGPREAVLMRRLARALQEGEREIVLTPGDVEEMTRRASGAPEPRPLPDAFGVMATVAAADDAAIAQGDFRVLLRSADGPSGARLLGRFCHADGALNRAVEEHLRAEEALDPEALFAEVVHLPEGRLGNILARPVLRSHEIVYLGQSGASVERQIPVTDLLVSVQRERIVLHSARLGRRVVPRLTSAHNFARRSMPVYRFLCQLQAAGTSGGIGWDWGPTLAASPFLPRLRWGRVVLALARWRVGADELKQLGAHDGGAPLFAAVQRWRAMRNLPRLVQLADQDNVLPVDLDNALSVETFVHLVRRRAEATVEELFPDHNELCAHGAEGRFTHEIVVPFVRSVERKTSRGNETMVIERAIDAIVYSGGGPPEPGTLRQQSPPYAPPRTFPPGSEWLYLKLYAGSATADRVLCEAVQPLVSRALERGWADRWFFIRYADPEPHVRVRFRGSPEVLHRELLPAAQEAGAALVEGGKAWRVQLDTYEREVERYGGPDGMDVAERIFQMESEAALVVAGLVASGRLGPDDRWRLALAGADTLLSDLGLDLAAKRALVRRLNEDSLEEFGGGPPLRRQLSERYRKERSSLEALLDLATEPPRSLRAGIMINRRLSERVAPLISELRMLEQAGRLTMPVVELASTYLHMHINRLVRSAARAQELVLYDFLCRLYESVAGRTGVSR